MAVAPINLARVSNNLRAFTLLNAIRGSQLGLFRSQNQIATGLKFLAPSEDPVAAASAGKLDRRLDLQGHVMRNLDAANAALTEVDDAMAAGVELVSEAHRLALEAVNDTLSAEERRSLSVVVNSMLEQAVTIGNRRHLDAYLFGGDYGDSRPFELTDRGVVFRGDGGRLETIVDTDLTNDSFTISGTEYFNAVSESVSGAIDLNPSLTADTRIEDVRGANGAGVTLGRVMITIGATQFDVDLSGAATFGDVLDRLNAALPTTVRASLTASSIQIAPVAGSPPIMIEDVAGGRTAADLGISTTAPVGSVLGADLDPRLTLRTELDDLFGGAGLNAAGGIRIRSGLDSVDVNLSSARTIEDVLNTINNTELGVWARISADGRRLEVLNRTSGADMTIEEVGGTLATALGIRSLYGGTPLSALNDGLGVSTVAGDDFRIATADGTSIDIDLDALNLSTATIQDVIDLINNRAAGAVTASLAVDGNGILINDNTAGAGALSIVRLNVSPAIDGLGLDVPASGNQVLGRDVNPIRVNSPFTAMIELRDALNQNDSQAISLAATRVQDTLGRMQEVHGALAAKARAMQDRTTRVDRETTTTRILLSDVRDVDLSEAIVRFQQLQNALQASLGTASRVLNLSLLDYLR
jgi:flagellar hook-associated protein 3 FlgL